PEPLRPVDQQPGPLADSIDDKLLVLPVLDRVSDAKPHTPQRRIRARILALRPCGRELRSNTPVRDANNRAKPQFRLTLADPSLAGMKVVAHSYSFAQR